MASDTPSIVLFGLESRFGLDAVETVAGAGRRLRACVASRHDRETAGDFPRVESAEALRGSGLDCVIPLLTPGRRKQRAEEALALGLRFGAPVAHAAAALSPSARIAEGALIGPLSVIAANFSAGAHLMLNRGAAIGHDCRFGAYCTIGPGVTLCGGCVLEDGVYVGAGATLGPLVRVGRNAVVGAGAVVMRDVEAGTVVVGNPARTIRTGIAGYRDTGV